MPNSEQEMRERVWQFYRENHGLSPTEMLMRFALLERRDDIQTVQVELGRARIQTNEIEIIALERIINLLRAKLTPAPEAEKGQKNG